MTTYTAAIDTENGEFCDVSVVEDEISGYVRTEGGSESPQTTLSGRYALEPVATAIPISHPDVLGVVEQDAERVLRENGWRVTGKWEVADNALYASAERA